MRSVLVLLSTAVFQCGAVLVSYEANFCIEHILHSVIHDPLGSSHPRFARAK